MFENKKIFAALALIIGFSALTLQMYFSIVYWMENGMTFWEALGQHFSYYTILINLLVCLCFVAVLAGGKSQTGKLFFRKSIFAMAAINIIFVAIAYNLLLRDLWHPIGLQFIVNEVLHSIMPVLFILFYILYMTDDTLQMKNIYLWLLFPVIYAFIILIRGAYTGFYPYPFLEVNKLQYSLVLKNILFLLFGYFILSWFFILLDRNFNMKKNSFTKQLHD
jgi:hypothetical protein